MTMQSTLHTPTTGTPGETMYAEYDCAQCGKHVRKHQAKGMHHRFCSRACKSTWQRAKKFVDRNEEVSLSITENELTVRIHLTKNQIAIVDRADSDLDQISWQALFNANYGDGGNFVACRKVSIGHDKTRFEYMHRVIMERMIDRPLLKSEQVDHIDLNPLHNWRSNLRMATRSQNGANRRVPKNNTSGFKGVSYHSQRHKWRATIQFNGKYMHLGLFNSPEEAHKKYCEVAKELYGEFARYE